jgi:hypothetical protein
MTGFYGPTQGRRGRIIVGGRPLKTINSPPNPKAKNRVKGKPKRTEWLVCEPNDRQALLDIGERCVRGWREGEPVVSVRHTSSLTPGAYR